MESLSDIAARVIRAHEPRPFGCTCGAQFGDSIDQRWHLVNQAVVATTERLLAGTGWVNAGPDAELVTKLLADPHRGDHILDLRDDGWTLQHPITERIAGDLFVCPLNKHVDLMRQEWENDANAEGRYRVWLEGDDEDPELGMDGLRS